MATVLNKRDVALQASSPRTLSNDLSNFRTTGAPTNSPAIGSIATSLSSVGTVDITLSWTYTQGAIRAEEFILYYAEGTTNPTTSSPILAKVDGAARSITIPGVPIEKSYRAGIVASRVSAAGVESTSIVNSWARTGTAANITANINGTAASTITGHVSATGNVHSVDLSQITGDLDDISNGVTYFRTSANQVTGAGRAYNALDSSSEYVKSLTSTKLTVVGANPSTGWVGDTNGIRMYQSGVLKVNIPVSGSPSFSGDITGGSNIDITGQGKFGGNGSLGGYSAAILANNGKSSANGVVAWSGSSASDAAVLGLATSASVYGVYGYASAASTTAVFGSAVTSTATGVTASNSAGGTALKVLGPMTITSSALVSNLRSATCLLADNSTKWNGFTPSGVSTGSATATLTLTNKPGVNSANTWWTVTDGTTTMRLPVWIT